MALDKAALPELLDALRAGVDLNAARAGTRLVAHALIDLDATERRGASPYGVPQGCSVRVPGSGGISGSR